MLGLFTDMMPATWLVVMVLLLMIEAAVPGLVSIWFALGALSALIAAILHAPFWLQVTWFVVVSVLSLILTRPLVHKYVNSKTQPTNADMLIGKECVVREKIDNLTATGVVYVGGKEWTARMDADGESAEAGSIVKIVRIEGVKLIVK